MYAPLMAILFLVTNPVASTSKFDNEIIGIPEVACEAFGIRVRVQTARPFDGRVYVKGEFKNSQCGRTYHSGRAIRPSPTHDDDDSDEDLFWAERYQRPPVRRPPSEEWKAHGGVTGSRNKHPFPVAFGGSRPGGEAPKTENQIKILRENNRISPLSCPTAEEICEPCECNQRMRRQTHWIELDVPIGACNAKRDRIMNPPSLVTSFVAVVSFHGSFITKIDRAYHIKCTFNETSVPVHTDINVTMSEDTQLTGRAAPTSCEYNLLNANGFPVVNVQVGDQIRHEWKCEGPVSARLLVHSCYVEGDGGIKQLVIDEHGCSIDEFALPTPVYSPDGKVAATEAYVFKFPDQSAVTFRCDMRTCHSNDPDCAEDTPPKCDLRKRKKRSLRRSPPPESTTLHSRTLMVLDMDTKPEGRSEALPLTATPSEFCLSIAGFGVLVSATTFVLTSSAAVVIGQMFSRRHS